MSDYYDLTQKAADVDDTIQKAYAVKSKLEHLSGVTSELQAQIDGKQPTGSYAELTASNSFTGNNSFSGALTSITKGILLGQVRFTPALIDHTYTPGSPYDLGGLSPNYDTIIFADTTSGTVDIKLPDPTTNRMLVIKDSGNNAGTNNITIQRYSAEEIEFASADYVISVNGASVFLQSNGTDWFII